MLECVARSSKTDNLRMAVMHGETLLSMLQVLDGEGGKITKRYGILYLQPFISWKWMATKKVDL